MQSFIAGSLPDCRPGRSPFRAGFFTHRSPLESAAMRICRFDDNRLGLVEGEAVRDVSAVLERLAPVRYPFPRHDALIARLDELRPVEVAA